MPIVRRMISQDESDTNQWLKVDHASRFIMNDSPEWQIVFGPNSELTTSNLVIRVAGKFDDSTLSNIKVIAYLYDQQNASIGNSASCTFALYKVNNPSWSESLITTLTGTQLPNSYYFIEPATASLSQFNFDGGDTIMIEATIVRLGITYRDRIYINHLGVYDNLLRVRQDVEFLDMTKQDE